MFNIYACRKRNFLVAIVFIIAIIGANHLVLNAAETDKAKSGISGTATKRTVINLSELARLEMENPPPLPENPKVIPFMPLPEGGTPDEGIIYPESRLGTNIAKARPGDLILSPAPSASFAALGDNNTSIPPDTYGAVGLNHLMVTLNTQVRIQNRSGGTISTVSLDGFWASLGNPNAFDPKVLYDPYSNRWMFTAMANSSSANSALLIGVTQTSDPTGNWNLYSIDADPSDILWIDYPSMGFNKDWIVVQANMYPNSGGSFNHSDIYVFNKADLYSNGSGLYTLFHLSGFGGTQVPAITHSNTVATVYLMQNWNGNSGGNGWLRLYTITGLLGSEVFTFVTDIQITSNPWAGVGLPGRADFAPQLGSGQKIQANDDRMKSVVFRNGSVWCTHTIFLPAGASPTRSSIQWLELNTAGAVLQMGRIDDPGDVLFYAFPSIAVNMNDDVLIGYSRFSTNQYAAANYSFRTAADPLGTLQSEYILKAGEASYYKIFSGTRNRWGDYSNTVVDPVNDIDMWTIQEYTATPSGGFDRWGTWWGKISLSSPIPTLSEWGMLIMGLLLLAAGTIAVIRRRKVALRNTA